MRSDRRLIDVLVVALLALLAFVSVALHTLGYTKVSPVDELQHIDYLHRAPAPPSYGDRVGQDAMREQACRGLDFVGEGPRACTASDVYDPDTFQERGYSTGSVNSPVYYTLTKAFAGPLRAAGGVDSLVTTGRLAGGLWLSLGLSIAYLTAVARGTGRLAAASVMALLAASPALIFPSSTISPDSMGLLAGALMVASLTWWERNRSRSAGVAFVACAVFVASVKMTFVLAVGAAALTLILTSNRNRGGRPSRWFMTPDAALALGASASALVTALAWMAIQASRPQMDPDALPDLATRFLVPEFPWHGLLESGLTLVTPLSTGWVLVGDPAAYSFTTSVPSIVVLSGIVAAGLFRAVGSDHLALASATLAVAVVGGIGLVTVNYLTSESYFPLPARYGSALVAAMAVTSASSVRGRGAAVALAVVAAGTLAVSLTRLAAL